MDLISRSIARIQHEWMGRPEHVLFFGHGIGDDLLCTAVARELKKRGAGRIVMLSRHPSLFQNNPDIHAVYRRGYPTAGRRRYAGYSTIIPQYARYDPLTDKDFNPRAHFIETMCGMAGISGELEIKPYIHLTDDEKRNGNLVSRQLVIHTGGLTGDGRMMNKEWCEGRFQNVVDRLRGEVNFVQLGNSYEPPLTGVFDLRGKTTLRESAGILSQSMAFIGLAGFQMHLARAVDCRGVIVYGGREDPAVSGYECNENLQGLPPCAPCWQRSRCDINRECMRMIDVGRVVEATKRQVSLWGHPVVSEKTLITADSLLTQVLTSTSQSPS